MKHGLGLRPGRCAPYGIVALLAGLAVACSSQMAAPAASGDPLEGPLTIARQGSFFVGGEHRTVDAPPGGFGGGDITINQDRNSLELADLILGWIDEHVGTRRSSV